MYRSDRILGGDKALYRSDRRIYLEEIKPCIVVIGYLEEIKPCIVVIGYLEEIKPCIVVIGYLEEIKPSDRIDSCIVVIG